MPSMEGPHRRYYGITDHGRVVLDHARVTWKDFSKALDALLTIDAEVPA
jgi:PadR family transcriptional regulator PadR